MLQSEIVLATSVPTLLQNTEHFCKICTSSCNFNVNYIEYVRAGKSGMFLTGCRKWNCYVKVFNDGVMPFICFPAIL